MSEHVPRGEGRPPGPTDPPAALFVPDGDLLVPTELALGPWSRDGLHGGAVAAITVRACEQLSPVGGPHRLHLSRLTLDLLRPVPAAPLRVTATVGRPGKRVQVVDVVVEALTPSAGAGAVPGGGAVTVARARALCIRVDPTLRMAPVTPADPPPPGPERGVAFVPQPGTPRAFHSEGVELRFVEGRFDEPGPGTVWIRLRCPVVMGEEATPHQRAMAAADFGNGVGAELRLATALFINPDLTVSLLRPPVGEWTCLDARTHFGEPGVGMAQSVLWDEAARLGSATQHLLMEPLA